jgi:hypothetical protein
MIPSATLPDALSAIIQSATRVLVGNEPFPWDVSNTDCLERVFQDAQMPVSPALAAHSQKSLSGQPLRVRFNLD